VSSLWRWGRRAAYSVALVLVTLVVGGAWDANRRLPDLKPWHRVRLDDMTAAVLDDRFTFARYQAWEERLFAQVRAVEAATEPADRTAVNRYYPGSLSHPASAGRDWNRSFETTPPVVRGGALLVHGLTDSPYSMRTVAEVLRDNGIYSLSLRLPGHGTVPSGLVTATADDWLAAVRVGVRHVRSRIPEGAPLLLVGYSNGGALAVKYTLDVIGGSVGPRPSTLILLSPMIGVSPAAGLARWISLLGVVPYFEKANWLDVYPEYNPFKYNSFAANAGYQTGELTRTIRNDLARLTGSGQLAAMPPILTFQSIVDATVSTPAVVTTLYDQLPANGSELVLFDVNQVSGISVFLQPSERSLVATLLERAPRRYRRVVVTNTSPDTRDVEVRSAEAGSVTVTHRPLAMAWPAEMFSLTHVGVPFPPDDPLYGFDSSGGLPGLLPLGRLSPRGERGVLVVGTDSLMRLSSNPFFPFVAERIAQWVAAAPASPGGAAPPGVLSAAAPRR
jgi:alpha-beta hydrolase superfamily lysophospholipase